MTRVDRLAAYFTAWPDRWIDARELMGIAGTMAWRTRVSNLRRKRKWVIDNRLRRVKIRTGETITISEYKYVPRTEDVRDDDLGSCPSVCSSPSHARNVSE